jgi:MYXO-CTERM domain-containing protein
VVSTINKFNELHVGIEFAFSLSQANAAHSIAWRYLMDRYRLALAATTALVASTSLSRANVITVTASHASVTNWGTSTQTVGYTPNFNVVVPGFNTALGTLTGVVITLTSTANGSIILKNNGGTATNVSSFLNDIEKNILPGGITKQINISTGAFTNPSLAGGASVGPQAVTGHSSKSQSYSTGLSVFNSAWSFLAGDFGSVNVTSGNGNGSATYTDTSSVLASVAYTFTPKSTTPTPEPATMTVLASGLAGLGLLRRRRK